MVSEAFSKWSWLVFYYMKPVWKPANSEFISCNSDLFSSEFWLILTMIVFPPSNTKISCLQFLSNNSDFFCKIARKNYNCEIPFKLLLIYFFCGGNGLPHFMILIKITKHISIISIKNEMEIAFCYKICLYSTIHVYTVMKDYWEWIVVISIWETFIFV